MLRVVCANGLLIQGSGQCTEQGQGIYSIVGRAPWPPIFLKDVVEVIVQKEACHTKFLFPVSCIYFHFLVSLYTVYRGVFLCIRIVSRSYDYF